MSRSVLQYYCGNCDNILKETESDVLPSHSIESCPYCGTLLSDSLQRRTLNQNTKSSFTLFQKASQIPKLVLDIEGLDSVLHFLTLNQKVCISGIHAQKLVERLCVRAQMPHRYGGLDTKVLLIDGANSSDIYQCIDFAQQYGLDVKKILNGIITSRAFTAYQLANLIINEIQGIIKKYKIKVLIITNLLNFFSNDPFTDSKEMENILKQVIRSLKKIRECLVVVSLGFPTNLDAIMYDMFSKIVKIEPKDNALYVKVSENKKSKLVMLRKDALDKIPRY